MDIINSMNIMYVIKMVLFPENTQMYFLKIDWGYHITIDFTMIPFKNRNSSECIVFFFALGKFC